MNIAEQIKSFCTMECRECGNSEFDIISLMAVAEERGEVSLFDEDTESTEYHFADGSVMVVCGDNVSTYGSR